MSSKRSVSLCSRSPKFYSENQNSRLLFSSTCSTTSQISKSPFENIICSQDDIQGSSAILAAELDKLILINAGLTKEISTWKRKYKECYKLLEHHLPQETDGNSEYKQKYDKLKIKATEMKKEFKVLEGAIVDKDQEIGAWEQKYSQMEQEYIDQIQNLRNQIEIVLKTQIEKEVTLAFSHFEKEKVAKQEDWEALMTKLNQSQVELRFVSEEKEQAMKRVEEMKGKLELAEGKNIGLETVNKEYKTLNEEHEKTLKQLEQVREQLSAKEVACKSIQSKCTAMSGDIEKLRETIKEQTTKCVLTQKELNSVNEEKEKLYKQLDQTKEQLKTVEKNCKDAQCKYILRSEEVERLRSGEGEKDIRVRRFTEEMAALNRERDAVLEQIEDVKAELIIVKDYNKELQGKNEVLSREVEEKNERIVEIEKGLTLVGEEKRNVENKIEEMKLKVLSREESDDNRIKVMETLHANEREQLKGELKRIRELVEMNEKLLSSLEEEVKAKEKQIKVKECELRDYHDKGLRQQEELKGLQDSIVALNQEIVLLKAAQALHNGELRRKDDVLESIKAGFIGEVERLKAKIGEYEESLERLKKEKSDLRTRLEKIEQESVESLKSSDRNIEEYEKRVKVLIEKNGLLMEESEELKRKVEKLSVEKQVNEELKIELVKNEILMKDLMRMLGVDSNRIVSRIEEIMRDIVRLAQDNSGLKGIIEQEKNKGGALENKLKELELGWGQLKASLEEEGVVEMVKKIEAYKREVKKLSCETAVLKKRVEDQEMRNIQEIDRVRSDTESMWKKRMEAEVESKKLAMRGNEECEAEIKALVEKNEKLSVRVNELIQEIEASKLNFEEEKVMESRLTGLKFELEKERRVQQEKEFTNIEAQWKEKVSFHEGQAKNWKAKVEDFELRQVMYFIEIERLYGINAGLIADVNKLTLDLKESSMELEKNRKLIFEATKIESARSQQRDQFEEVAQELTKQVEALERKFQFHVEEKKQGDGLAIETPVKLEGFGERKGKRGQYNSIQKSHAELRDLALKFESEKKTMECQLTQLKKIVEMNKSEMRKINQDNTAIRNAGENLLQEFNNQRSPSIKFGDEYNLGLEQPKQSYYGSEDMRAKSPFQSHSGSLGYNQFTISAGKENIRSMPTLSLTKSASQSVLGFRSNGFQREDDSSLYPKVSIFKY